LIQIAQDIGIWFLLVYRMNGGRLNTDDEDDYETIDEFITKFSDYGLGGGITHITFENPIK
jgi:hypothetical protein